jgi:hypothetical protein
MRRNMSEPMIDSETDESGRPWLVGNDGVLIGGNRGSILWLELEHTAAWPPDLGGTSETDTRGSWTLAA